MSAISRRDFLKTTAVLGGSTMLFGASALAQENPLKVRAAVFSPTGGTMNAAYMLASMLGNDPEMIDQTALASRNETLAFAKDELAVFAAPAYAGKIPFAPKLFENIQGDQTPCVLVAAFGNREAENCLAQMNKLASDRGFIVIGAIDPKTLAINNEICIECQRCSHVCPAAARTYVTDWDGTDSKYLAPRKPITYVL